MESITMTPSEPHDALATGCPSIDETLNGGFPRGEVTQLYGKAGSGKTNLVTATSVQTAATGGTVFFCVTEDSPLDRIETLAAAHPQTTVDDVFDRIFLNSVSDFDEQHAIIQNTERIADRADLIVVDSLSGFYRLERGQQDGNSASLEQRMIDQVIQLLTVARREHIAVLVTNQVYYHPDRGRIQPLGGTTLQNWCQFIAHLEAFSNDRYALTVKKHPTLANETALFTITEDGLHPPSQA